MQIAKDSLLTFPPFPFNPIIFKGTVSRDFLLLIFYESVSPQPQSVLLGPFRIFSKIHGDIRSSRLTTGVADTGGKWKKSLIRKILIILLGHLWICSLILFPLFAAGINNSSETGGKIVNLDLLIFPRIFEKIRNGPNSILRGLGETDSWKKTRSKKSRDTVPLPHFSHGFWVLDLFLPPPPPYPL
jgi:hypothetical protein